MCLVLASTETKEKIDLLLNLLRSPCKLNKKKSSVQKIDRMKGMRQFVEDSSTISVFGAAVPTCRKTTRFSGTTLLSLSLAKSPLQWARKVQKACSLTFVNQDLISCAGS
jgi:hypothetical protein